MVYYLANEGGVIAVAEVDGQHIVRELFHFFNDEALPVLGPANDVIVFFILNERTITSKIS